MTNKHSQKKKMVQEKKCCFLNLKKMNKTKRGSGVTGEKGGNKKQEDMEGRGGGRGRGVVQNPNNQSERRSKTSNTKEVKQEKANYKEHRKGKAVRHEKYPKGKKEITKKSKICRKKGAGKKKGPREKTIKYHGGGKNHRSTKKG